MPKSTTAIATKADLLAAAEPVEELVPLGKGKPAVRMIGLTAEEFDKVHDAATQTRNGRAQFNTGKFRRLLVAHSLRGSDGRRLFGDDQQDLTAIKKMPATRFNELAAAANRVNGLSVSEDPSEAPEASDDGSCSD